MRGRGATVEQTGLGGDERSGADADDATAVLGRDLYPADGVRIVPDGIDSAAARQHECVDGFARVGQRLGNEFKAGAGGDRFAPAGHDRYCVTLIEASLARQKHRRPGEHLDRADQVESLNARIAEDHYRSHESSVGERRRVV